jgi:hypothetical protein
MPNDRIVDENIDCAKPVQSCGDERLDVTWIADIGPVVGDGHPGTMLEVFAHRFDRFGRLDAVEHDAASGLRQPLGERKPEAPGGSSENCNATVQRPAPSGSFGVEITDVCNVRHSPERSLWEASSAGRRGVPETAACREPADFFRSVNKGESLSGLGTGNKKRQSNGAACRLQGPARDLERTGAQLCAFALNDFEFEVDDAAAQVIRSIHDAA